MIQGEFQVPDQDSSNGVEPFPVFTYATGMFSRLSFGAFEMWTCAGCGFSELYATNFQNLDIAQSQGRVRFFDASAPQGHGYR